MKKLALLFFLLNATGIFAFSQGPATEDISKFTEINWQLDSLIPCYHYKKIDTGIYSRNIMNVYGFPADSVPAYSNSVYSERLKDMGAAISMDYNEYVQAYINMYVNTRREQVERMLGLKHIYFPIFEEELDRQGVPMELKYLPIVESALNPHARSRVGATGLWQFMLKTGELYGLKVDSYIDERKDPYKSTEAAVRYLKNMHKTYGDWLLVIAAYNCGPGNVNKAIARSNGKRTFWEIRDNLPKETRGYVPAFIAAAYVFNYHTEHNLFPKMVDFSFNLDTLHFTRKKISLKNFADLTDTDFYLLKDLNPELKKDVIPYSSKPYVLRVPMKTGQFVAAFRDSIFDYIEGINADTVQMAYNTSKVSPLTNKEYSTVKTTSTGSTSSESSGNIAGRTLVYHKVRSGEVVSVIAEKYHVSWQQIKTWNNLKGYNIKPGQTLKIYVPNKYATTVSKNNEQHTVTVSKTNKDGTLYHVVKSGDTLWDIAKAYDGVTVEQIKALNNLKSNSLKVGQTLRIQ